MKLLRNPIVTGILAIVALVVVYVQVIAPHIRFKSPVAAPRPAAALPLPTPVRPSMPAASSPVSTRQTVKTKADPAPGPDIDRSYVELHFSGWANWPRRDPFFLIMPDLPQTATKEAEVSSPVGTWKLRAIWEQAGSRVAVINSGSYREGDVLQGYKIIKIEGDEVWFQGPRRKERLGFDRVLPPHP
jgi:hypothetical protein